MSGGSKSYAIKPLFINQLFPRTFLEVIILYFDKIGQILIISGCILILQKREQSDDLTFTLSINTVFFLEPTVNQKYY